jgi:hypothetical protein
MFADRSQYHYECALSYIAYYEITIEAEHTFEDFPTRKPTFNSKRTDCIAIGLATDLFPLTGKEPGWDQFSFGYHG